MIDRRAFLKAAAGAGALALVAACQPLDTGTSTGGGEQVKTSKKASNKQHHAGNWYQCVCGGNARTKEAIVHNYTSYHGPHIVKLVYNPNA